MWTWEEEWKEKLNKALFGWNKFREDENALLSWLSSKEQSLDMIGETDITDEEQVKMHLNLLQVKMDQFTKVIKIRDQLTIKINSMGYFTWLRYKFVLLFKGNL